jgi:hypothetical protein
MVLAISLTSPFEVDEGILFVQMISTCLRGAKRKGGLRQYFVDNTTALGVERE